MQKLSKAVIVFCAILLFASVSAYASPFPVWPEPRVPEDYTAWGFVVDGQTWGNWFKVTIPYSSEAAMSGTYAIEMDFLIWVDPNTSDYPETYTNEKWWNHADPSGTPQYGLGEFFDAGIQASDQFYYLTLTLGSTDTWSVFYDSSHDNTPDQVILSGTVTSYSDNNGFFYGILTDDDGVYNGFPSHNEGTPDLVDAVFHVGSVAPVPEPSTVLLIGAGLVGLVALGRKKFFQSA